MGISGSITREGIEMMFGSRFIDGNSAELLVHGEIVFGRLFGIINEARHSVCLQFYIFRNDATGMELAELLKRKSGDGVRVHLIYDHLGSFGTPESFWQSLRAGGVQVQASRPFRWGSPSLYFHRDHRKLVICDGHVAYIGGLNIANEYRDIGTIRAWRDTGLIVRGPAAWALMDIFMKSWVRSGGRAITVPQGNPSATEGTLPALPIFAHTVKGRRRLRRLLYHSIRAAQKDICLVTAYFTPSLRMLLSLEAAVARGVRVRLIVPADSDVPAAHYAGRAFFSRLLRAGVGIYAYQDTMLHAKTYVFDSIWSIVGSANLDFRSLRWNDEGNVGIHDAGFGATCMESFNRDLENSVMLDSARWSKRPLKAKIMERVYAIFRRRL